MKERIFALKKGTEVPAQFDGATIPFQVPTSDAEIAKLVPNEQARVAVFNQAYSLNLQKAVKAAAGAKVEAGQPAITIESLRKVAADYKVGDTVRTKGPGSGKPKVSQKAVAGALGDDFLATLTPAQRKLYDEKMAALAAKPAEGTAEAPATSAAPAKGKTK